MIPNFHTFRTYRQGERSGQSTKPWPAFSSVRTKSMAYCEMPWRPVRCRLMLPHPGDNFLPPPLEGLVEHRHVHWGSWAPWLTLQMAFILQLVMMHFARGASLPRQRGRQAQGDEVASVSLQRLRWLDSCLAHAKGCPFDEDIVSLWEQGGGGTIPEAFKVSGM